MSLFVGRDIPVSFVGHPGDALVYRARALLEGSSYLALRGLTCASIEGVLAVEGELPTHFLRQVAMEQLRLLGESHSLDLRGVTVRGRGDGARP